MRLSVMIMLYMCVSISYRTCTIEPSSGYRQEKYHEIIYYDHAVHVCMSIRYRTCTIEPSAGYRQENYHEIMIMLHLCICLSVTEHARQGRVRIKKGKIS
jgi:hypothetical protein